MAVTLHVTSYKNHALNDELSVTINEAGCTIGRASDNDFVLPDVELLISQRHAIIEFENGAYYLTDKSTNGTYINNAPEPIEKGKRIRLHDGDILTIGKYNCAFSMSISMNEQQTPVVDLPHNEMWKSPPLPANAHENPPSWKESYHEPLVPPISPPPSKGLDPAPEQDYFRPPDAIPEDWDVVTGKKLVIEQEVTLDMSEPEKKPAPAQPPYQNHEKPVVKPKPKARRDTKKSTYLDQQALDAFLAGAGLTQVEIEPEAIISFMNTAGQMMREITQGYRQILDSRTRTKDEFRLGMTTIRPVENNPLKFSIDVEDALTRLLLPPSKGYLPPVEAIQEATDDIQAHQMALLAGLRAALSSLVALFDPEALEKDSQQVSAVDNLLPFTRKARYWELFKIRYRQAAADAENDFLHFLGDEFAIAYELQIQRLKSARRKNKL